MVIIAFCEEIRQTKHEIEAHNRVDMAFEDNSFILFLR